MLVSRPPVLQRAPDALEREYYRFNTALAHRLQQPFQVDQYFKKGSTAEMRFQAYYEQLKKTWDVSTETVSRDELQRKAENSESEAELYATLPRTTDADAQNDVRTLDRALDRTLYLVVKRGDDAAWRLPALALPTERTVNDSLHATAEDAVTDVIGDEMDLWLVSKLPIAVVPAHGTEPKTYILKSHILAGDAQPAQGADFAWLTLQELEERFREDTSSGAQAYWEIVRDLLDE